MACLRMSCLGRPRARAQQLGRRRVSLQRTRERYQTLPKEPVKVQNLTANGVPMFLHPADVAVIRARASEDTGAPRVEGTASPRRAQVHTETTLSVVATERAAAAKLAPLPKENGAPKVRKRQALLPKDLLQSLRRDFVEACMSHGLSIDHLTVPPFLCPRRTPFCRVAGTLAASISSMEVVTWSITSYGTCPPLASARRSENVANSAACNSLGSGIPLPASLVVWITSSSALFLVLRQLEMADLDGVGSS